MIIHLLILEGHRDLEPIPVDIRQAEYTLDRADTQRHTVQLSPQNLISNLAPPVVTKVDEPSLGECLSSGIHVLFRPNYPGQHTQNPSYTEILGSLTIQQN